MSQTTLRETNSLGEGLLENTEPTDTQGAGALLGTNLNIDLNNTFNPTTPGPIPPDPVMGEEELKTQLMEELHEVVARMTKATKETQSGTERDILLRELRHKKIELSRQLASLAFNRECKKYNKKVAAKKKKQKQKIN